MSLADALARKRPPEPEDEPEATPQPTGDRTRYGEAALEDECAAVQAEPKGSRNHRLNKAAHAMGQLVAAGAIDEQRVKHELHRAAKAAGLERGEILGTLRSGLEAGKREPRRIPERPKPAPSRPAKAKSAEPPPDDGYEHTDQDAPGAPPGGKSDPDGGTPSATPTTPADVVRGWQSEGPLVRVPTGIETLDRMCRGGLPVPWRVVFVGAPSAGKTGVATIIANRMALAAGAAGLFVGILAVDEEPEDLTVRFAQMAGYTVKEAEQRDPAQLGEIAEALSAHRIRLYDCTHTIESAADDLAGWCTAEDGRGVLFVDSMQAATSEAAANATTPREMVEGNVRAIRWVSTHHRLLVVATSEANRASYRNDDAAQTSNDMAAGAESRAIEFSAQTLLMLRTPKDEPNVIHARVAKNRRAERGEFWLQLDREGHTVKECPNPDADPAAVANREEAKRAGARAEVARDAKELARLLFRHPQGLGERELRAELKAAGLKWGRDRLDAARIALTSGRDGVRLVDAAPAKGGQRCWRLERTDSEGGAE
jgi:KaiC/GvpD/RAD55 family RecA-like ATPase